MPSWTMTLRLGDLVSQWKSGELTISQLAEKVAVRIEASRWRSISDDPDELDTILDDLKKVESAVQYVQVFDALYDLADLDRVWIETT